MNFSLPTPTYEFVIMGKTQDDKYYSMCFMPNDARGAHGKANRVPVFNSSVEILNHTPESGLRLAFDHFYSHEGEFFHSLVGKAKEFELFVIKEEKALVPSCYLVMLVYGLEDLCQADRENSEKYGLDPSYESVILFTNDYLKSQHVAPRIRNGKKQEKLMGFLGGYLERPKHLPKLDRYYYWQYAMAETAGEIGVYELYEFLYPEFCQEYD